jgi:hypothetical protein
MKKSELLRALQTEIRKHGLNTSVDRFVGCTTNLFWDMHGQIRCVLMESLDIFNQQRDCRA